MAPSFANIFMGKVEKDLLKQVTHRPTHMYYLELKLREFCEEINSFHLTIKFTAEWSRKSITFLDTTVIRKGNCLVTDLYTKPTDTHQYLHCCSCHPSHCKRSIAYSQALTMRRICSSTTDYERHVKELKGTWSKGATMGKQFKNELIRPLTEIEQNY